MSIFREYDIRGLAGSELNNDFAFQLGRALCRFLGPGPHTLGIGRDCRLTSDAYAVALASGIFYEKSEAIDLGMCPTPGTYFAAWTRPYDATVMVTGSHNPAEYNGFKISLGKQSLYGAELQRLQTMLPSDTVIFSHPAPQDFITQAYENYLIASTPLNFTGLRVVVDAGNGAASLAAPRVLTRLGADVIPLFCEPDGRFPNHHPDPTVPENMQALIKAVKEHKAHCGIAFDGDADRIGVVDETGRILYGDELMILFARHVLKQNPGATIMSEVKSSMTLYDAIQQAGGNALMWKTGHSLIKAKMKETGALLAGEMSGHIFFADRSFGYDDALYAAIRLLEIMTDNPILSRHFDGIPKTFSTPEIRVDCADDKKFIIVEKLQALVRTEHPELTMLTIDGARISFPDGWGLVRASNTQPVIVMRFEALSAARLNEIEHFVRALGARCGLA